uniref:Uncharacterized protein n=1 Tax=Haptolina ericina TaxID=156174 RepID=A0A7S3AET9_9EUKA|mmetsp:Transcript_15314/g.34230  ORF Transcript_15314/g.34230 Transcript_15314/m.34230 type:complete len:151 (+) Transcript_15314:3-455(+)
MPPLRLAHAIAAEVGSVRVPTPLERWTKQLTLFGRPRLVVLCGAGDEALLDHPVLLEHTAVLQFVSMLTEEQCAARGGCDSLVDLWQAMGNVDPFLVLAAPCATRRTRKQLLHRFSKHPIASQYVWQVLAGPDVDGSSAPSAEEGWESVL